MSSSNGCGATTVTHRQDGPYPVKLGEAYEPLKKMSLLLVGRSESGDRKGDRGQGWLVARVSVLISERSAVPPPS
jgi:hypothetical protein